jgi:hypothetical protein
MSDSYDRRQFPRFHRDLSSTKPTWPRFFPPGMVEAKSNQQPVLGSLRSLIFTRFVSYDISHDAYLENFNKLCCLIKPKNNAALS